MEPINDKHTQQLLLCAMGDEVSQKILFSLMGTSMTIPEILVHTKTAQTSGYRKVKEMIENGLLKKSGEIILPKDKRVVNKYTMQYRTIHLTIDGGCLIMSAQNN